MDKKAIGIKLKNMGISPYLLNWGDDIVPSTKIWYDEETGTMCADCGVSIPIDESMDITKILIDIEDAIIKYYKEQGIGLAYSYV